MANEEVLRLRTTVSTEEGMAQIRALGREIGLLPEKSKRPIEETNKGFKTLTESVKRFSEQVLKAVPGLESFGLGAAGAGLAAATLIGTLSRISTKIVELQFASKELGMSERDLRAWSLAAQKAAISPETMMQGLKSFHNVSQGFKYNLGGVRDELVAMGAGPVVARIMAARTETEKLKQAFDFKDALMKADPSGFKAQQFMQMMGFGAEAARLSYEQFAKAQASIKPMSDDDIKRAEKFRDAMIELGEKWDTLLQKTALRLFPNMQKELDDLGKIIGYLEKLDTMLGGNKEGESGDAMGRFVTKLLGTGQGSRSEGARRGSRPGWTAPHRALGGPVGSGLPYIVGEEGPELMVPHTSGRIIPTSGGDRNDGVRMIKQGVFEALVDFKSYMEAGSGGRAGLMQANFGGSGGAAAGGGWGGGSSGGGSGGSHSGGGTDGQTTAPSDASQMPASIPGGVPGLISGAEGQKIPFGVAPAGGMTVAESPGFGGIPLPKMGGGGGGASGNLAAQRAGFMKELDADPALKAFAIDAMQHEGGIQSNMEQLFNYASMRGMTIKQALHSGQYGPVRHGLISGNISAKTRREGEAALKAVGAGSNIIDYATDQGMKGDPNYAKYMSDPAYWGMHQVEGAWFSAHGEQGRKWATEQRARDAANPSVPANGQAQGNAGGGSYSGQGSMGANERLVAAVRGGASYLPPGYTVRQTSGFRGGTMQSYHGKHMAADFQIIDPSGKAIPNEGEDTTGMYTLLARGVKTWTNANDPQIGSQIGYGGAFGTKLGGGGVPDLMHYDLGGSRGRMRPDVQFSKLKPLDYAPTSRVDGAVAGNTATGTVKVTVNSNGTAAKTDASADGLWQKTTIQNYKQMQPTNSPSQLAAGN